MHQLLDDRLYEADCPGLLTVHASSSDFPSCSPYFTIHQCPSLQVLGEKIDECNPLIPHQIRLMSRFSIVWLASAQVLVLLLSRELPWLGMSPQHDFQSKTMMALPEIKAVLECYQHKRKLKSRTSSITQLFSLELFRFFGVLGWRRDKNSDLDLKNP